MSSAVLWRNIPCRFRRRSLVVIRFSRVLTGLSIILQQSGPLLLWLSWFARGVRRGGFGGDFSFGEAGGPFVLP